MGSGKYLKGWPGLDRPQPGVKGPRLRGESGNRLRPSVGFPHEVACASPERNVREVPSFPRLARAHKAATEAARGKVGLRSPSPVTPLPRAVLGADRFLLGAWVPHLDGLHCHPLPVGPSNFQGSRGHQRQQSVLS